MRNPKQVEVADSLNIQSLKHLALQIGIPREEIIAVSAEIEYHFRVIEIRQA